MDLKTATKNILQDIYRFTELISDENYSKALDVFSGSSISMHIRHILEFYQCLYEQSQTGKINYDKRKRNKHIETGTEFTQIVIEDLTNWTDHIDLDKNLKLSASYGHQIDDFIDVNSNMRRELIYNLEHAIHHLALVKIGFNLLHPEIILPEHFGIAPSTIKFNNQESCAH